MIHKNRPLAVSTLLVLAFLMPLTSVALSGKGTESSPYIIQTASEFASIPNGTTAYYKLGNDIHDCAMRQIKFCGHLDGSGHSIYLNISTTNKSVGLFNECNGATISNLKIKGSIKCECSQYDDSSSFSVTYKFSGITAYYYYYLSSISIGTVCVVSNSSTFINIENEAIVYGEISGSYKDGTSYYSKMGSDCAIGGLVARSNSSKYSECANYAKVSADFGVEYKDSNYGGIQNVSLTVKSNYVGGLIGNSTNDIFENCFVKSDVLTLSSPKPSFKGGFMGISNSSEINNSYFNGNAIAPFADVASSTIITNSLVNTQDISYNSGITYKSCFYKESEDSSAPVGTTGVDPLYFTMQQWYSENLPSWDFENIWYMPGGDDALPLFRITPVLTYSENQSIYGGSANFESSNPYSDLLIEPYTNDVVEVNGASVHFMKAGIIELAISQNGVSPYKPLNTKVIVDVAKAPLSVTVQDKEIEYGDSPSEENLLTYSGFVNGDDASCLAQMPNVVFGGTNTSDVGTYNIVCSGAESANYEITYIPGLLTIKPRTLFATPMDATRKYGSPNPTFKINYEGFVNGHNEAMITESPIVSTQANKYSDVGEYSLVCRGGSVHPNYNLVPNIGILTIEKATLTIKANDLICNEGDLIPELTLKYIGFKNEDDESCIDEQPNIYCEATPASPEGIYTIFVEGGEDNNYAFDLKNGTLLIKKTSGIEDIVADSDKPTQKFYDMQGVEINQENLVPGIYIKVQEGVSSKIIIR